MPSETPSRYTIDVLRVAGAGSPWIVRVYKRILIFKRRISSDWFLDEAQARKFAREVGATLSGNGTAAVLRQREPGWTFKRPSR